MFRRNTYQTTWQFLLLLLPASALQATSPQPPGHRHLEQHGLGQDEIWMVNTRNVHCLKSELAPSKLHISRLCNHQWVPREFAQYAHSRPSAPTVVYVHGNRMNAHEAWWRGLMLYRHVLSGGNRPPIRFVIWSWPSGKVSGPLRDIRTKAARTNREQEYLSWFLCQSRTAAPTSLIGYSFGARIVTGTLQAMPEAGDSTRNVRAALLAAAVHQDWLGADGRHGQAPSRANGLLLLVNRRDPALMLYPHLEPCSDPEALGYRGFPEAVRQRPDVEQLDVTRIVGRSHYELRYYGSNIIRDRLRPFLLWETMESLAGP